MENIRRLHPGIYIKELLDSMEMTSKEFSLRTGISERTLSSIINGNGDITFDVAYKLSSYFDNSLSYWTNLQNQYNVYILRLIKEKEIEEEYNLIKPIKKYLIEYKYIESTDSHEEIVLKTRELVGVNSLLLLNKKDTFVSLKELQTKNESNYFYQNLWIALALKESRRKNDIPYNKKLLLESIEKIKKLTIEKPEEFYPKLQNIFENCGISFVLLPYLPKSNIYGATKWFSKDNVMLAVSNRGKSADSFWFTLFHEISHVLMEHRRETLIHMSDKEDNDANIMAADLLIPRDKWNEFKKTEFTLENILLLSEELEIHPSIILGRLHKEEELPYGQIDKEYNVQYDIKII